MDEWDESFKSSAIVTESKRNILGFAKGFSPIKIFEIYKLKWIILLNRLVFTINVNFDITLKMINCNSDVETAN